MALIEITCMNPACGATCTKNWYAHRPPPRYCSFSCSKVHNNAEKRAAGVAVWHKYTFTPEMDTAIIRAYRGKFGSLKRLWHEDPRFERAGLPYPILQRRTKQLGLARTDTHDQWTPEETALCVQLYTQGYALETIRKKLKAVGSLRSPSAIVQRMHMVGESRHQEFLSLSQFALALGLDDHIVARWVREGLLPVAYCAENGRKQYLSYPVMRQFCLDHPLRVARGAPNIPWLIALLVPPQVGHTQDRPGRAADEDGAWLNGAAVPDRAAAD